MAPKVKITNNIRRFRFEAGEMSQQALATRIGVTRQTLLAIENEKYAPSLELAALIARAFDTTIDAVFTIEFIET